ncbi:hypothetical protein ABFS83_14G156500 [Erythranthe nasuta]
MDGGGGGRRVGYEYNYRFSIDNDMLSNTKDYILYPGVKNIIFEIRTNFIIKTNKTTIRDSNDNDDDDDDKDEVIGSEKFSVAVLKEGDDECILFSHTWHRLEDYWMTLDEVLKLCRDAVDFAQSQPSDLDVVPISVGLDVFTVQHQEGETIEATMERAITSKRLVPLYLWPSIYTVKKNRNEPPWLIDFLRNLKRIRVLNVEEWLRIMNVCSICSKGPAIGAQISCLGTCGHAFHSHCIVGLLEHDNLCHTCRFPAYDPYLRLHFD